MDTKQNSAFQGGEQRGTSGELPYNGCNISVLHESALENEQANAESAPYHPS